MVATLGSRLLGYARERVIAHNFGSHWYTEAFVSAFNLPDLIYYLLAGGALGAAFIPVLTEYFSRGEEEAGHRLACSILNLMVLALAAASVLAIIFAPALVRVIARGYEPGVDPRYALTVTLTRVITGMIVLMGISALTTAILQCHDHFFWPAVAWCTYSVGIIAGATWIASWLGGSKEHQILGLALGVWLGALLLVGAQLPALARRGFRWRPVLELGHPDVRRTLKAWFPVMLGLAISQVNLLWLPVVLGTYFSGAQEGIVLDIRLANRLIVFVLGMVGVAIGTAAFPTMARQSAEGELEGLRRTLSGGLRYIFFLAAPAMAGLLVLSVPVTRALWRGGAYTEAAVLANARLVVFFSLGLLGLCALQLITRGFYALRDFTTPVKVGVATFGLNLGLSWWLMHTGLRYGGIALAVSVTFTLNALVLVALLRRRLGRIEGRAIANSLWRVGVAAVLMAVLARAAAELVGARLGGSVGSASLQVLAGLVVGMPAYLLLAAALRVPEVGAAWRIAGRRLGRGSAASGS